MTYKVTIVYNRLTVGNYSNTAWYFFRQRLPHASHLGLIPVDYEQFGEPWVIKESRLVFGVINESDIVNAIEANLKEPWVITIDYEEVP